MLCTDGGCEVADGGVGAGAGSVVGFAAGWAEAGKTDVEKDDKSPDRRLATTMVPNPLLTRPRAELNDFMVFLLAIIWVTSTGKDGPSV